MVVKAVEPKLTKEDRTVIVNWIRERGGDLYKRRIKTEGDTVKTLSQAVDQACLEFVAGKGPTI